MEFGICFPGCHKLGVFRSINMLLSPRMPDLDSFEVLVAIAQTGSLGGAARELGLTQQAVSRRLASMEAKTGVALAVRTTRGSQLTPAGASVAEWASCLLDVARDVDKGLGSLRKEEDQRISVVATPVIAEYLMPHWLLSLQSAESWQPGLGPRVDLTAATTVQAEASVRNGSVDLGFVESLSPPTGLGNCVVSTDELVVVVLPNHKWARRSRAISALELAQTSLVSRGLHSGVRDSLAAALRRVLGRDMRLAPPLLELPSPGAVRAAALAGAGPAVMSRLVVTDDLATGRLRQIAFAELDLQRELRAIWRGGRRPPVGAVRNLLSHIGCCSW